MEKDLMKMNLQFFAEEDGAGEDAGTDDSTGAGDDSSNAGDQNQDNSGNAGGESGEKTFTQAELSAVAAAEKKQGKAAILNMFGVKDEKTAKEQAKAFKEWQQSQKNTEEKLKDSEANLVEAEAKAQVAENKLACVMAGVNKDSIEDALAIATLKVTDDKDLNSVLEEMKKEPKYKGFFTTDSSGSNGTGNPAGHGSGTSSKGTENIGERLGKAKAVEAKKSNYFSR